MSHIPLRTEKDCLNCGTIVQGRYCHQCGQENVVPKETFWHMVTHFFYDITHFDGKFFESLKDLLFRPGFLSKEYMKGRRARYLHPIKMYVFTSALFFLLFFSFFTGGTFKMTSIEEMPGSDRLEELADVEKTLRKDSAKANKDSAVWGQRIRKLQALKDTTKPISMKDFEDIGAELFVIDLSGQKGKYTNIAQYDSIQKSLPKSERDGWFLKRLIKKELSINERYRSNPKAAGDKLSYNILHKLPYMLFVSLPLFALILKLLYIRRKDFYYADHGVFTIHLYIFSFILLLTVFCINRLKDATGWGFLDYMVVILILGLNFYLYKAMRRFYGQRRFKTIVKFFMVAVFSFIMMLVLLAIFLFFSAYEL